MDFIMVLYNVSAALRLTPEFKSMIGYNWPSLLCIMKSHKGKILYHSENNMVQRYPTPEYFIIKMPIWENLSLIFAIQLLQLNLYGLEGQLIIRGNGSDFFSPIASWLWRTLNESSSCISAQDTRFTI
jgi:hypothetical protein